jgi:hypothetical protein
MLLPVSKSSQISLGIMGPRQSYNNLAQLRMHPAVLSNLGLLWIWPHFKL